MFNTKSKISIAAGWVASFIASAVSLLFLNIASLVLIPDFNFVVIQGSIFGQGSIVGITRNLFSDLIIYFVIGIFIWGTLYTIIESRFAVDSGPEAKGALFGLLIWLVVMILLMPLAGVGFFIEQHGFSFEASLITLVSDLLFGMITGYFYSKLKR